MELAPASLSLTLARQIGELETCLQGTQTRERAQEESPCQDSDPGWERTWRDTLRQASPTLAGQASAVVQCVSAQRPFSSPGFDILSSLPPVTDSPTPCGPDG